MADVTAALDTWSVAAIDGSDGRKILVANVPVAANAQITAMQAGTERSSNSGVDTLLGRSRTVMVMRPQILPQRPGAAPEFMRWCDGSAVLARRPSWTIEFWMSSSKPGNHSVFERSGYRFA